MEATETNILKAIEKIHLQSKDSKLILEQYAEVKNELVFVSNYFNINDIQAILISSFICVSCFEEIETVAVCAHFGMEKLAFIYYANDIQLLIDKNILDKKFQSKFSFESYMIKKHLTEFIISNQPIPQELIKINPAEDTFHEFLGSIDKLSDQKDSKEIDPTFFYFKFRELIHKNKKFKLVHYVYENGLKLIEMFVFFDVVIDAIAKGENNFQSGLQSTVDDFTNRNRDTFEFIAEFLANKSKLTQLDLLEKDMSEFASKHKIQLTQKALTMLEEMEGIKIGFKENRNNKLAYPDTIQKTNLFYNPAEKQQLNTVLKSMSHSSFSNLQKRLKANKLPLGVTSLLYGAPGTGKTETVYQIAKKYRRPIFKVDIAESKSMWFGESQKLVKKIFTDYYDFKKDEKVCPILLFNEADAIIGKRKNAGSTSVADTENAIQNILLEELENFNGILFATSNLVQNLDPAFERRFLFKIKFDTPSPEHAAKIWKNKLPMISSKQAVILASSFTFSGGEMENIARKCIMEEVIFGTKVSFEKVISFCENEKWDKNRGSTKIGF
jgi:DNA polymerase III delta prime subunit